MSRFAKAGGHAAKKRRALRRLTDFLERVAGLSCVGLFEDGAWSRILSSFAGIAFPGFRLRELRSRAILDRRASFLC